MCCNFFLFQDRIPKLKHFCNAMVKLSFACVVYRLMPMPKTWWVLFLMHVHVTKTLFLSGVAYRLSFECFFSSNQFILGKCSLRANGWSTTKEKNSSISIADKSSQWWHRKHRYSRKYKKNNQQSVLLSNKCTRGNLTIIIHCSFSFFLSLSLSLLRAAERFLVKWHHRVSRISYLCVCVCVCVYAWREIAAVKHQTRAHDKLKTKKTLKGCEIVLGKREQVCVTYCADGKGEYLWAECTCLYVCEVL